jgi:hypothetical protein
MLSKVSRKDTPGLQLNRGQVGHAHETSDTEIGYLDFSSRSLSADNMIHLQRTLGNRAVVQMLRDKQSSMSVQRMPADKRAKTKIKAAADSIEKDEADVEACYVWATQLNEFEAFTASKEAFEIYQQLRTAKPTYAANQISDAVGNDSGQFVEEAKAVIRAASRTPVPVVETPTPKPKAVQSPKPSTKVPKEMSFGESQIVAPVRPSAGNTFAELEGIDKGKYPATFASTMLAIAAAGTATLTVGAAEILKHNKGTVKETVEVRVSIRDAAKGKTHFFVVHYHPKAVMPTGAISGHSDIHVKGTRGVKHHETMTESALTAVGIPSLSAIKALGLT